VTNSVRDRGLKHYTFGLEASEIHAYELARCEHKYLRIRQRAYRGEGPNRLSIRLP